MSRLIIKNESGKHQVPLYGLISIGRHPQNKVCISESEVSKQHATIQCVDNTYIFKDLGSANGSFFHEVPIQEHIFSDGDTIRIGHTLLTFCAESKAQQDINRLVSFEQFDDSKTSKIQARVELNEEERFLPEKEVDDEQFLREDYEKLRLGQELLKFIGLEQDLNTLLKVIAKQLVPMFGADRSVILIEDKAGDFKPKAVYSKKTLSSPIIVSQSVLKEVQQSKSAVLLSKSESLDQITQVESLKVMGITSVMCAPIIHEGIVIGAIHLDLQTGQNLFLKKDLQLLGSISSYIAMALANAKLTEKIGRDIRMQSQFERLLSPNIVKQLLSGELNIDEEGKKRLVTIMFVDIRGFTRMSRDVPPESIVSLLNQYFERVVEIVFKHGGTVDKFMGDAVMVLFGAPIPMSQQADACISCAREIQSMVTEWNIERTRVKLGLISVGIGINSGEVVVGAIGSSQTLQYTCIGNAVNVSSRLTGLAQKGQIIVSQATIDLLKLEVEFNPLPPQAIKGIPEKVSICEIIG